MKDISSGLWGLQKSKQIYQQPTHSIYGYQTVFYVVVSTMLYLQIHIYFLRICLSKLYGGGLVTEGHKFPSNILSMVASDVNGVRMRLMRLKWTETLCKQGIDEGGKDT